jgi:hypothetical protein
MMNQEKSSAAMLEEMRTDIACLWYRLAMESIGYDIAALRAELHKMNCHA